MGVELYGQTQKIRYFRTRDLLQIQQVQNLNKEDYEALSVVSRVLPFRVNSYIVNELVNWQNVPNDPIYQMNFLRKDMLAPEHYSQIKNLIDNYASDAEIEKAVTEIRQQMNPHPAGQTTANVPELKGQPVPGIQHKYKETVLFFPSAGQTCHAFCTFCFRWPQFVSPKLHTFSSTKENFHLEYLKEHKEVTDYILTGGDPMVMNANKLKECLEPILHKDFEHVQNIRIGTKSITHWPYRYTSDKDSEEILRLFERIHNSGKHLAIMAHINHPQELEPPVVKTAVDRILATGAQIRTQAPLLKQINDDPDVWASMWKQQVKLGMIPYYMFIERNTGPKLYFELPLVRCWEIYQKAMKQVSGLARTVRGPSMSAFPGKVNVEGVIEMGGKKALALSFLQGRNADWCRRPFLAKHDEKATWLSDLKPFEGDKFFFED
jgi:KamA family protein